jgi:hypothetical protein
LKKEIKTSMQGTRIVRRTHFLLSLEKAPTTTMFPPSKNSANTMATSYTFP